MFNPEETQYEVLRRRGICRRDFLNFCSMAAVALGLGPMGHLEIAHAMETKPYLPVLWINGLSCSCCTESFIRSAHPLASDIILSMIALDYQDTIMAAAGDQAMECFEEAISTYKGRYILAVEGNPPLGEEGMYCIDGGRPFMDKLQRGAAGAKAIVAWGTCASWGCVQAARPNPTQATPIHKVIHDKPIIKVPGCPAIPDVMSNIVAYVLTYDQIPKLDSQGRPEVFYGKRVHDQCVRRAHFDAGQFVESWDDAAARLGDCRYNMANSLIVGGLKVGMNVAVATPDGYKPDGAVLEFTKGYGDKFALETDPFMAASGADILITDTWTSMGEEAEKEERKKIFKDYQINKQLLTAANAGAMVQHCLPAYRGQEITEEVFEEHADEIFNEAENRLHAQKAVMVKLMKKD